MGMIQMRPRPFPPYLLAYPEDQRSLVEASYRKAEAEWQREAGHHLALNAALALPGFLAAAGLAFWVAWNADLIVRVMGRL
jgi:hypothetical protein